MFRLSADAIDTGREEAMLADPRTGAVAVFEGRVRDYNDGRRVLRLEYEAFGPLALSEGGKIVAEARARFPIHHIRCVHRTGALEIGDAAIWLGVSAAHRGAAFDACRYVIDELKARLPIWKREHYADGAIEWVNCRQCAQHAAHDNPQSRHSSGEEAQYYARQTILAEIGTNGQEKLRQARVLVVGAGGLGSAALPYLAGAGVGTLGIAEFDMLDATNLHRQALYDYIDCGEPKATLAVRRLRALNPFIDVRPHPDGLYPDNAQALFSAYDLVLDCSDNAPARRLLAETAVRTQKPLIQAAVYQFEGHLALYQAGPTSPCLRCLWPEEAGFPADAGKGSHPKAASAAAGGMLPQSGGNSCLSAGVLGVTPGLLGIWQASEAIKLILGLPTPLADHLMLVNLLTCEAQRIRRFRDPACLFCGGRASTAGAHTPAPEPASLRISEPVSSNPLSTPDASSSQASGNPSTPVLRPADLAGKLRKLLTVIDLREPHEKSALATDLLDALGHGRRSVPFSQWSGLEASGIPESPQGLLLVCEYGLRSLQLARRLRSEGHDRVFSLAGGVAALRALSPNPPCPSGPSNGRTDASPREATA